MKTGVETSVFLYGQVWFLTEEVLHGYFIFGFSNLEQA